MTELIVQLVAGDADANEALMRLIKQTLTACGLAPGSSASIDGGVSLSATCASVFDDASRVALESMTKCIIGIDRRDDLYFHWICS